MAFLDNIHYVRDTANRNGVALNKKFTESYVRDHSMTDGARALAEKILDGMVRMCKHGVNNDFSQCKGALDDLADIVVALTELDAGKISKLDKYKIKADNILQKEMNSRGNGIDVAEPLRECTMSCLQAIDVMTELSAGGYLKNLDGTQSKLLEQSRDLINDIVVELEEVSDTSSTEAQEKADSALNSLNEWREACSRNMLTSKSMQSLRSALDRVKEWRTLVSVVGKKNKAKEQHKFHDDDDLSSIVESKGVLEEVNTFMRRMESEKTEIAEAKEKIQSFSGETRKKIDEYTAEIENIEQQLEEVKKQFQNGDLDLPTANRKMKELKAKMDEPLYQRGLLKDKLQRDNPYVDLEVELENREAIFNAILPIFNKLDLHKNDLVFLVDAVSGVDLYALVDMLEGSLNDSDQNAFESIHYISMAFEEKVKRAEQRRKKIEADSQRIRQKTGQRTSTREEILERERAERNRLADDSEIDPELLALMGQTGQQQQQGQQEQPVKRKIVPLSGDEL